MIAVRKLNEDKAAKLQRELDAARISEKNAATERDFLKLDAAEAERSKRATKEKAPDKGDALNATTPKKKKLFSHRDGFDDDEIESLSPSKLSPSNPRRTTGSPSKQSKRKRKTVESPARPLEVINDGESSIEDPKQPMLDETLLKRLVLQDDRFDVQCIPCF